MSDNQAPAGGSQGTGQGLDLSPTPVALGARPA